MVDATAESNIAWVEEAQTLSKRSLALLRPTIRTDNSELWFSFNPRRRTDAVDEFLRGEKPDRRRQTWPDIAICTVWAQPDGDRTKP